MKKGDPIRRIPGTAALTGFWIIEEISDDGRRLLVRKRGSPETRTWVDAADYELVKTIGRR